MASTAFTSNDSLFTFFSKQKFVLFSFTKIILLVIHLYITDSLRSIAIFVDSLQFRLNLLHYRCDTSYFEKVFPSLRIRSLTIVEFIFNYSNIEYNVNNFLMLYNTRAYSSSSFLMQGSLETVFELNCIQHQIHNLEFLFKISCETAISLLNQLYIGSSLTIDSSVSSSYAHSVHFFSFCASVCLQVGSAKVNDRQRKTRPDKRQ